MELTVQKREKFGKAVKALRREGFIPAELYGHGIKNLHLAVSAKDFSRVFREAGTSSVVNLLISGGLSTPHHPSTSSGDTGQVGSGYDKRPVVIHDIGRNYLTGEIDHVDFYQVRMDEKIKAKIPLEFLGAAPAVKDKGGILNKSISEIEVEALPADLPRGFEVDLSVLVDLNQSIYVKDIKVPRGVKVLVDPETPVVTVTEPRAEEVVEAAPAVDVSAVKVETEEKKAERARFAEGTAKREAEKAGERAEEENTKG